ncbi:hypothetical protein [Cryobacterium arcticum]|uniref:hypothetical protein n=1 Tax=Cryobacterium arcticum TaxID=670052 RepID=UPI0011B840C6|nr:hypothetical protein [Cryobacterium arcticum]
MTTKEEFDAFKGHRLWASSSNVVSAALAAIGRTTTDRYTVARAVAVARYVKSFRPIEPYLFPSQRISQAEALAAQTDGVLTQLAGWDQSAAMLPATVNAIDAGCDQILSYLTDFKWPSGRRGTEGDGVSASIDAYRQVADQSLEGIAEQIAAAQARLLKLEEQANALAEASAARALEAEASLTEIQALDQLQADNATKYLKEVLGDVRSEADQQRSTLKDEAAVFLASLKENHESGNDLIKKIADRAVGGNYLDFAEHEKKAYGNWNKIAIGSALLAFIYLAAEFAFGNHDVEGAALRVGVSLTLVALSAYAFREAGKRQRQSVEARYRALDVIAMPSFSKGMSVEQSERLRYLMGERLFGSHVDGEGISSNKGEAVNISLDPATVKAVADAYKAAKAAGLIA